MPDLEDLITRATSGPRIASTCWAAALQGDARRFVEALDALERERHGSVNRTRTREILASEFGVDIANETVRKHFSRNCRCGR